MKVQSLICVFAIGAVLSSASFLAADPDAAAHNDAPNPAAKPDPGTEPMWQFTSYLKGTTSQVRQQINGEVERLMAKVRATQKAIADDKAAVKAEEKAAVDRLGRDARYVSLKAESKKAEVELETARKSGTSQERLDASSHYNHLRASLEQMENDSMARDQALNDDRAALREETAGLKKHLEALDRAQKWRETLLDAIRTAVRFKWPLKPGQAGLLGKVTPRQIIDAHTILIDYEAYEEVGLGAVKEDIQEVDVIPHPVKLLVSGIDTKELAEKKPVELDKTFVVINSDEDGRYVVRQTPPSALDDFFEKVVTLRTIPDE